MSKRITRNFCVPILISSIMLLIIWAPSDSHAQWHSNVESKKGMSTETLILVGVGTFAAVLIISKIIKDNAQAKEKEQKKK